MVTCRSRSREGHSLFELAHLIVEQASFTFTKDMHPAISLINGRSPALAPEREFII